MLHSPSFASVTKPVNHVTPWAQADKRQAGKLKSYLNVMSSLLQYTDTVAQGQSVNILFNSLNVRL
jgi:hypothetical protein